MERAIQTLLLVQNMSLSFIENYFQYYLIEEPSRDFTKK